MIKSKKGFTLIEVILVMVILAISLPPLCILIVNVVRKNVLTQVQATATALAEGEMEKVTNMRFSGIATTAQTAFSAPFTAYNYTITVDYVNASDLNTPVVPGPTNYKRVQVMVNNAISGNLTLTTLIANDW